MGFTVFKKLYYICTRNKNYGTMDKFVIKKSKNRRGWYVCTDTENLIVCKFKAHRFNDTQDFTILEESKFYPVTADVAVILSRIAAEMGDWLRSNHYDIIF